MTVNQLAALANDDAPFVMGKTTTTVQVWQAREHVFPTTCMGMSTMKATVRGIEFDMPYEKFIEAICTTPNYRFVCSLELEKREVDLVLSDAYEAGNAPYYSEFWYTQIKARSISVGDIIKVDGKYYVCCFSGWKEITCSLSSTHMKVHTPYTNE